MNFKYWFENQTIEDAKIIAAGMENGLQCLPLKPFWRFVDSGKADKIIVNLIPESENNLIKDKILTYEFIKKNGVTLTRRIS